MAKKATAKGKSKKRKISGSKGKVTAKRQKKQTDPRGVVGLIVLCIGVLALVCQFVPSSGNVLNQCKYLVRGLGGTLCLLLPLVIIGVGAALVFFKENKVSIRTVVCVSLIFLFVEGFLQLFEVNDIISTLMADGKAINYATFLGRAYSFSSYECSGGGLIGALIAWPLFCAVDVWGSVLILLCAVLITLMVLTGMSFSSVGMSLSQWFDDLRVEIAERREEHEAMREMEEEKRLEQERERAEQQKKKREEREEKQRREQTQQAVEEQTVKGQASKSAEQKEGAAGRTKKKNAPAQRVSPFVQSGDLYIERDDEFQRDRLEERPEYRNSVSMSDGFTLAEAEEAFLYGMDAPRKRRARKTEQDASAQPPAAQKDTLFEEEAVGEAPFEEAPFEKHDSMQMDENTDSEVIDDEDFFDLGGNEFAAEEESEDEAFEQIEPELTRFAAQPSPQREEGGVPSPIPASDIGRAPQTRAAEPQEAQEDRTIVQLRGTRLDGTPLVMPQKDTHKMPEAIKKYVYPPMDLLERSGKTVDPHQRARDEERARTLLETLDSFHVVASLKGITHGPAITRYELQPGPGVKVSRITGLVDDIALNMAVDGVRIAPVPGMPYVGIEVPNDSIEMVPLRDILESREMTTKASPTLVALGKDITGTPVAMELSAMPHLLIAGATGSGKSVCINTIICSLLFRASPEEVRLILIDPKAVELSVYQGVPHLLIPVVTDPQKASAALSWAVVEMEHRYNRFKTMGVRNIKGYNKAIGPNEEKMCSIIVVIDELADLMMVAPGEVEDSICRLAQLARAAGIHLVIATQRPSVNVITGDIKVNIPSRIAFAVSSQPDSRTILDGVGAEKLLGKGDMLYAPQERNKPTRVQGCFISDDECMRIVDFVKNHQEVEYSEEVIQMLDAAVEVAAENKGNSKEKESDAAEDAEDELLYKAIDLAVQAGTVSISMLQRRLRVGYARAGRLVDEMTVRGFVAEAEGPTKPRTTLISREEWMQMRKQLQENKE